MQSEISHLKEVEIPQLTQENDRVKAHLSTEEQKVKDLESERDHLHKEITQLKESLVELQKQKGENATQHHAEQQQLIHERNELKREITHLKEVEIVRMEKDKEESADQLANQEKKIEGE